MSKTYRSNFEELVATKLKLTDYETDKFKYTIPASKHTYTPDFKVAPSVYLETKGRLTAKDRAKHLRVAAENPKLVIAFVFQEAYNTLYKGSKTTYADWAEKNKFLWFDWKEHQKELQTFISQKSLKPKKVQ